MKKFELNKEEEQTLKIVLGTIDLMTQTNSLEEICDNENVDEATFSSICKKVFNDLNSLDEFMKTKGFSPESSGGGCMWYVKKTRGGLTVTVTDADGMHLPETMGEPIITGLLDSEGETVIETEHTSLNEFFNRTNYFL